MNTFSPEGRLFQVEYAIEAIKVSSAPSDCQTDVKGSFELKSWVWSEIKQAGSTHLGSGLTLQRGRVWPAPRVVHNTEWELVPFPVGAAPVCNCSGNSLPAFHLQFVVGELHGSVRFLPSSQSSCHSALLWVVKNQKPSIYPNAG